MVLAIHPLSAILHAQSSNSQNGREGNDERDRTASPDGLRPEDSRSGSDLASPMRLGAPTPSRTRQLSHSQSGSGERNRREQELQAEARKRSISCGGNTGIVHGQGESGRVSALGQDGLLSSAGFASGQAGSDRMSLTTVEVRSEEGFLVDCSAGTASTII